MGQVSDEWWGLNRSAEGAFSRVGYARAEELWREALPLAEQLGEDDERYLKTITGICRAMIMQKKDWDVIPWLDKSYELHERKETRYNENCARITFRLAKTYRAYQMPVEAEEKYKLSLEIHTKVYGPQDSFTVEVLSDYAELLNELHREDEAQHMMYCAIGYLGGEWKPVSQRPQDVAPEPQSYAQDVPATNDITASGFNRMLKRRQ